MNLVQLNCLIEADRLFIKQLLLSNPSSLLILMWCLQDWVVLTDSPISHCWTFFNPAGDGSSGETPRWERPACRPTHSRATTSHRNQLWKTRHGTSHVRAVVCRRVFATLSSRHKLRMPQKTARMTWCNVEAVGHGGLQSPPLEPRSSSWKLTYWTSQRAVNKPKLTYRYEERTWGLSLKTFYFVNPRAM